MIIFQVLMNIQTLFLTNKSLFETSWMFKTERRILWMFYRVKNMTNIFFLMFCSFPFPLTRIRVTKSTAELMTSSCEVFIHWKGFSRCVVQEKERNNMGTDNSLWWVKLWPVSFRISHNKYKKIDKFEFHASS